MTAPITQDVLTIPRKLPEGGKTNLVGLTRDGLRAALIAAGTPEKQRVSLAIAIFAYVYSQPGGDPRVARAFTKALTAGTLGFFGGFFTSVTVSLLYMQFRMRHPLFLFDHDTIRHVVDRVLAVVVHLPVAGLIIAALGAGVHAYRRRSSFISAQPSGTANRR